MTSSDHKFICVHGHFYQPPRENPWLEEVEVQESAYPYHDWNKRITSECYGPNAASRILDAQGRIIDIVNNYSKISFNFGPTLLSWMEKKLPEIHQKIIEADRQSLDRFSGHGSALAQVYNHIIMPLANEDDKQTQVIWGKKDFEYRFGRQAEGMWLAEAAVDIKTLEVLAQQGIKFTILAPRQAKQIKLLENEEWQKVDESTINPKRPYLCKLPSGKQISIFFYDGPISQDVAFSGMLHKGEYFAERLLNAFQEDDQQEQLVNIATDGETYGHHHRYGDMALAYALHEIENNSETNITIYAEFLEKFPPKYEVQIHEKSSWSCVHGVERWRSDCGCHTGAHSQWHQKWRKPLREALDWLRENLIQIYNDHGSLLLKEPREARNDYISVILDRSEKNQEKFLARHAKTELTAEQKIKVFNLLEMQRHQLLMYTSCAWFFDEISGIETVQVMQYAARAMQLAGMITGNDLEEHFIVMLENALSNNQQFTTGARIYELLVKPTVLTFDRLAIHYGVTCLFAEEEAGERELYQYSFHKKYIIEEQAGIQKIVMGTVSVTSLLTGENRLIDFAVLHLGDHNLIGGGAEHISKQDFHQKYTAILDAFQRSEVAEVVHQIDKNFVERNYSLWHLFKDEQTQILDKIFAGTYEEVENSFRHIMSHHYSVLQSLGAASVNLPRYFLDILQFIHNADIARNLEKDSMELDELQRLVDEVKRWKLKLDKDKLAFLVNEKIDQFAEVWVDNKQDLQLMEKAVQFLKIVDELELDMNLWNAQNTYFSIGRELFASIEKARDKQSQKWLFLFESLGKYFRVKIDAKR